MRLRLALAGALLACGCGYVGEPLPPLLNIPARVADLAAVQKSDVIVLTFTPPQLTTEGTAVRKPPRYELRAGVATAPFNADEWAAGAQTVSTINVEDGRATAEIPAAPWVGKEVVFGLKAVSAKGRDAGWSNLVTLQVIPPLAVPAQLRPEAVPAGVRLTWTGHAPGWRVFRLAAGEKDYSLAAEPTAPEWTDTATQYGTTYRYRVQAVAKSGTAEAQSELSPEVEITPRDIFPPAVPAGLTAITGTNSIELAWERNTEPDLAGYRIYRSSGGAFEKVGESAEAPSFSDRKVEAGKTYRYAVSAFDKNGNESKRSEEVGAVAP